MIGGTDGTTRQISALYLNIGLFFFCRPFLVKKKDAWWPATTEKIQGLRRRIYRVVKSRGGKIAVLVYEVCQPRCVFG